LRTAVPEKLAKHCSLLAAIRPDKTVRPILRIEEDRRLICPSCLLKAQLDSSIGVISQVTIMLWVTTQDDLQCIESHPEPTVMLLLREHRTCLRTCILVWVMYDSKVHQLHTTVMTTMILGSAGKGNIPDILKEG